MPPSRRPSSDSTDHITSSTPTLDMLPADADDEAELTDSPEHSAPSQEELLAAWNAQQRHNKRAAAPSQAKAVAPDPYEPDDQVTLLLPTIYRAVMEGRESRGHRVFIGTEQPGQLNEDTGRPERGIAVTLTFTGGVCRDVPYSVVKGLKKSRAYRSNDALKVIPNDTQETTYAKLCGVQPMPAQKQAAMLLASDLDAVLAEFSTEQLMAFTEALKRRAQGAQAPQQPRSQPSDILSSQSFQRG